MPDEQNANRGGAPESRPPLRRRSSANRTILMALTAMLVGYVLAGRLEWLWKDNGDAKRDFEVMNTYARITVPGGPGLADSPAALAELAERAVREVNDLMGPFGERSDVRRLNEAPAGTWVEVDPSTWLVVMEALRWCRLSGGAFDPTIGPIKRLFTFDQSENAPWPDADALADARARTGADKLRYRREGMALSWAVDGMALDLGAIAKGYAADRAAEILRANGVRSALVDIGGELRVLGMKPGTPPTPWKAGIRNPRGGDVLEEMELSDAGVATSGDYERYFIHDGKRYEHIIDPRAGLPLTESVASVTVVHPNYCLAADALATTLCVLGPEDGLDFIREQALGLFRDGLRVVMLTVESDGGLMRHEIVVDDQGEVTARSTVIPPRDAQ